MDASLRRGRRPRSAKTRTSSAPISARPARSGPPMLEVRDLECRYGSVAALKGVSLSVERGQIVALIGANGAGKSTMLRSLSGLLAPSRGSILFDGEDIARLPPPQILRRGIAHCPEGRHVFPDMSVEENLDMGAYLRRDTAEIAVDRARILEQFP